MAGTRTTPPPIPNRPTRTPTASPNTSISRIIVVPHDSRARCARAGLSCLHFCGMANAGQPIVKTWQYCGPRSVRARSCYISYGFFLPSPSLFISSIENGVVFHTMATDRRPEFFKGAQLKVAIIGCGYVGLPLALRFAEAGHKVTGFDTDPEKVRLLNAGKSYIDHIPQTKIQQFVNTRHFSATADFSRLSETDVILICVPTPLNEYREPDLSYVENTAKSIQPHLTRGQLVVLESTTYPGTTEELVLPILEKSGLRCPIASGPENENVPLDFFLAFSPEREDPGNKQYGLAQIPKVVGGVNPPSGRAAQALYGQVVARVVPVSSTRAAEMAKLLENIFRCVNIALVNELKLLCLRMGVDVWEVIEAASTKPFGFMPFFPGPGLGGHCIPVDPYYLS